jgi:nucleotide-binding universal stress UspA family protein
MFKRILVPIDGSVRAEHAAYAAIELAKFLGASIVVLYVYPSLRISPVDPVAAPESESQETYSAVQQGTAARHLGIVERAAQAAGVHCMALCMENDSAPVAIVATANADNAPCDLIFLGSHGRDVFSQVFLGSVTTKVQALCSIPVLVYRDPPQRQAA